MRHHLHRLHAQFLPWHYLWSEALLILVMALLVFVNTASAAMRFQDRGLYMNDVTPGATTAYTISFTYMSALPVGSVDVLFCVSPIPYEECVTPPGLDASNAALSNQTGETGFSILSKSANHIILTRDPSTPTNPQSSYTFQGIKNPTNTDKSFSIRLKSLASTDGTGDQIDFGSVKGETTSGIVLETQVPPMLIFCAAQQVQDDCASTNETYYTDMGTLASDKTLYAQSQMAVGTNASAGFAITVSGIPPSAGTNSIDGLSTPTPSQPGTNQFGINLVANDAPYVGSDPVGPWANAVPMPDYDLANHYKYTSGDVVAYSPHVSLMRKFTISYVINSADSLPPGVYATTLTYLASGRF